MNDKYLRKFISEKYTLKIENIKPIGNHMLGRNYVYLINKNEMEMVIKVSISEKKWHNEIVAVKNLKGLEFIPEIYETGKTRDLYYQVMKKIDGNILNEKWFHKSFDNQIEISKELGKKLAKIHNWKSFKHYNSWEDVSKTDIVGNRKARDGKIIERLYTCDIRDSQIIELGISLLPRLRKSLKNRESVIVHRDYSFRNILINSNNDITGVLDFEHSIPDDPSMDICTILQTCMFDDGGLFESFVDGYSSIRMFPENFTNNKAYYYIITGLYICSKNANRKEEEILRGLSLIRKGLGE